jgi:hypothetical protein
MAGCGSAQRGINGGTGKFIAIWCQAAISLVANDSRALMRVRRQRWRADSKTI